MEVIVKKTTELLIEQKHQIVYLFNKVFKKNRTLTEFDNQYLNNPLGYSIHTLLVKGSKIVGHNAGIPSYYKVNGIKRLFICNVDTMIDKESRGIDNFYDLITNAKDAYHKMGVYMLYGFPNDNSYPILKQLELMHDIGKLCTYCLPVHISNIKESLPHLNYISNAICNLWVKATALFASSKIFNYQIEKESKSYNETRYKRSDGNYSIVKFPTYTLIYKIICYEGIQTAFIIDIINKSASNFNKSVRYLLKTEKNKFDLILYVGSLPFKMHGLLKIPKRFEPKHFNFMGEKIQDSNNENLFELSSWDVNLSNYDLI